MNKSRRNAINRLIEQLEEIQLTIEDLSEEEEECYYNLPESLRYGERGETMTDAIESLQSAFDACSEVIEALTDVIQ